MSPLQPTDALRGSPREAGFTLVELLAAMLVASVILLVLMECLNQATDAWMNQTKGFATQREARSGLRLLADDLAAVVALPRAPSADVRTRFYISFPPDEHASARVAFLRATRPETLGGGTPERGDVCLVMYGTALSPDGGASSTKDVTMSQKLMRRALSPEETFARIEAHLTNNAPLVTAEDWASLAQADENTAPLAYDVIRFDTVPYASTPPPEAIPGAVTTWDETVVPAWLDVTLRVTNRPTAVLLSSLEDWMGKGVHRAALTNGTPTDYSDDREVRTFVMRFRLHPATP